jgi:hypothetical protein
MDEVEASNMKKWFLWLILLISVFFIVKGLLTMFWYSPLFQVKTFHILYGSPSDSHLKEIGKKDAAIIESTAFSNEEIDVIKEQGTLLFGYVSLMQLENWNDPLTAQINESDFALVDGQKIYVKEWDTYVMDLREKHYREVLLWKVEKMITERRLHGVFFDTVDDLDYYFRDDPEVLNDMRAGYLDLLKQLQELHPDLLVIQNRGFETYDATSRKYVDGVLWEGFDAQDMTQSKWVKNWLTYFKKEQWWGRVRILTVVSDEESRKLSETEKFPAFIRKGNTYQK